MSADGVAIWAGNDIHRMLSAYRVASKRWRRTATTAASQGTGVPAGESVILTTGAAATEAGDAADTRDALACGATPLWLSGQLLPPKGAVEAGRTDGGQ